MSEDSENIPDIGFSEWQSLGQASIGLSGEAFDWLGGMATIDTRPASAAPARRFHPNPPETFLYLSGSSDVSDLRFAIKDRFDNQKLIAGQKSRAEAFMWEWEFREKPFDQRKTMQENLPDPRIENCRGVVAILGERIGLPLQHGYMADYIDDIDEWTSESRQFRLLPDWPFDEADQISALRKGYFPLTGTVFEYLAARAAPHPNREVFLAYISNKPVFPESFKPRVFEGRERTYENDGVTLNRERYNDYLRDELNYTPEQRGPLYDIQTYGVKNFLNALAERGIGTQHFTTQREAVDAALKFIFKPGFLFERVNTANPYRPLEVYDVFDGDVFFGREGVQDSICKELSVRLWGEGQAPLAQIEGPSGSGKSSLMRAGVVGRLLKEKALSAAVLLPQRLKSKLDSAPELAEFVVTLFSDEASVFGSTLDCSVAKAKAVRAAGVQAPAAAADLLSELVKGVGPNARILFAIDQFEEIVDECHHAETARRWQPFFDFIKAALATRRIGFVYTLESSRHARFAEIASDIGFAGAISQVIGGDDPSFLNSVIREPFQRLAQTPDHDDPDSLGFSQQRVLDEEVTNRLRRNYLKQIADPERARDGEAIWSTLPLLSIKLFLLYDFVEAHFGHLLPQSPVSVDDLAGQFDFTNVIEELAEEAWQRHPAQDEEDLLEDLDNFLTPFVRIDDEEGQQLRLLSASDSRLLSFSAKLERFKARRLIVPDGPGRWRLAHEAVINLWPLARRWRSNALAYLLEEQKLRTKERLWRKAGADPAALPTDDETMRQSVDVLGAYLHSWPFVAPGELSEGERNLRTFATMVLETSDTPNRSHDDALKFKRTHMHIACIYGLEDLVAKFIDIDATCLELGGGKTGNRPVHNAAWGQPGVLKLLLSHGADATTPNKLRSKGNSEDEENQEEAGWPPIVASIVQKDRECFDLLLPYYSDPATHACPNDRTLLHIAAEHGQADMARLLRLTAPGAELKPDYRGYTPLFTAVDADQWDTFVYFFELAGVEDLQVESRSILHVAAVSSLDILKYLLERPPYADWLESASDRGFDPLMEAAYAHNTDAVELMLKFVGPKRTIPDGLPGAGYTALHLAIVAADPTGKERPTTQKRIGATRTVRALLKHPDCDPNLIVGEGRKARSPFDLARDLPEVRVELARHPEFDRSAGLSDWASSLVEACRKRDRKSIDVLLEVEDEALDVISEGDTYLPTALVGAGYDKRILEAVRNGTLRVWGQKGAKVSLLGAALQLDTDDLMEAILAALPDTVDAEIGSELGMTLSQTLHRPRRRAVFERLMDLGADPDDFRGIVARPVLHSAAMLGDVPAIERILATHPRRLRDRWGRYPQAVAPAVSASEIEALIEAYRAEMTEPEITPSPRRRQNEAGSQATQRRRSTPALHAAALRGDLREMDRILSSAGFKEWPLDDWGRTPVDVAPLGVRDALERLLATAGDRRAAGRTPEQLMALRGDIDELSSVADRSASVLHRRDRWGRSLVDLAPLSSREAIAELLARSHGQQDRGTGSRRRNALHAVAVAGDMAALRKAARETPDTFRERDGWGRSLAVLAPLSVRDEIQALLDHQPDAMAQGDQSERFLAVRALAAAGDMEALRKAATETPEVFQERDRWGRAVWDHAPLEKRAEIETLAAGLRGDQKS